LSPVGATLIEDVSRIVFHLVLFEERDQFRLEIAAAMMDFLILDVPPHGFNIGTTHAKRRIAFLPRELRSFSRIQREEFALNNFTASAADSVAGNDARIWTWSPAPLNL
jgi:hypothetical protein